MTSAKRSYKAVKAQYQGKEKGEGKRKYRKITSASGPVSTSAAVREQSKTVRDGRRLSPKVNSGAPATPMVPGHR